LLQEERNARTILETMPIGVIVTDQSGTIQQLNQEARQIWGGITPVPEDYKDYNGCWPNTGQPIRPEEWAIRRAIEKGQSTLCEIVEFQCLDGINKTVLNSAVPLRSQGEITGAVDVMQDITGHHIQSESAKLSALLPK